MLHYYRNVTLLQKNTVGSILYYLCDEVKQIIIIMLLPSENWPRAAQRQALIARKIGQCSHKND